MNITHKNIVLRTLFMGCIVPCTHLICMDLSEALTPFIVKKKPSYALEKALKSKSPQKTIEAVDHYISRHNFLSLDSTLLMQLIHSGGQTVAQQICSYITLTNYPMIDQDLLATIIKYASTKSIEYLQSLRETLEEHPFLDMLFFTHGKITNIKNIEKVNFQTGKYVLTQSRQHATTCIRDIVYYSEYLKKSLPEISSMLFDLHQQEIKILKQGNYAFYHAQKSNLLMPNIVWKKLIEILYGITFPQTYYPLRFTFPGTYESDQTRDDIMQGTISAYTIGTRELEKNLIFMQDKIFGNMGTIGECTYDYFIANCNIQNYSIPVSILFEKVGLKKFYDIFSTRLENLESITSKRTHGTLLQFNLSSEQIKKAVYLTKPYSFPLTATINGKKTTNPLEVLEALRHDPKSLVDINNIMYCAVLSDGPEGLLNPFSPYCAKIHYYTAEDLRDWQKQMDKLFEEIKEAIMKDPETVIMIQKFRKDHAQEIEAFDNLQQHNIKSKL